jgi:5-oxoprolinase (ATP-hydrolysing) subunit A
MEYPATKDGAIGNRPVSSVMTSIDLNADLGEGSPQDERLLPLVSSANIACGGHAGDETTMRHTIRACLAARVAIGAHPGYEDRVQFGRVALEESIDETCQAVRRQIHCFLRIANECGAHPHHVKPHGALYTRAHTDTELAAAFAQTISDLMPGTMIYCLPCGELARAARRVGLRPVAEGFADRRYQPDGSLSPRTHPRAVLHDPKEAATQAWNIARQGQVITSHGTMILPSTHTLCVHGDSPSAHSILHAIHHLFVANGVRIQAPACEAIS